MFEDITAGVVCILDAYGRSVGTGFVVSDDGLIVTCAHVLGLSRPEKVTIIFRATHERRVARVKAEWWRSQDAEDVAVLEVDGDLPEAVQSLPLGSSGGTSGHKVGTFGFPEAGEVEGIYGVGEVAGTRSETRNGQPLLQLNSSEITTGFSGAPLWDEVRRRVIGMVVIVAKPDSSGKMGETAFATPTETLRVVCPALRLSEVCPYRNLDTFTEADTAFFFGRQRVIDELVKSLRHEPRFLAVFGPSGSGKSSVVQAGLVPQLRQGKVLGSDRWTIILTRPTDSSFEQILSLPDLSQHTQMAVVIDQFEELFVACPEALRQNALTKLTGLLEGSASITAILVMRDDFYSHFVEQEVLAGWLNRGLVNVPPKLRPDELVAIINEPAKAVGLRLEEGLGETIVRDAAEAAASHADGGRVTILPLLEFALTQLWERREEGMLKRKVYDDMGGVTGGLTQWADRAFYGLENQNKQHLARRIFTSLVYIGDENQGLHDSRRRISLTLLSRNERETEEVQRVIQQLASSRLLVTTQEMQTKQEVVEIIHDALLWEWGQLRQWLEEDHSFLVWHQELERQVRVWIETNVGDPTKREEYRLLGGPDLIKALQWLNMRSTDLSQVEQDFIQASRKRRKRNERRRVMFGLVIVGLVAVAGGVSVREALLSTPGNPRQLPSRNIPPLVISHSHSGPVNSAVWSPDGKLVASASNDRTVQVWDATTGTTRLIYHDHSSSVNSVAWSPNGKLIASGSNDNTVQVWDAATGKRRATYRGHADAVNSVAWSPDSRLIASGSNDTTVQVWDATTGSTCLIYRRHSALVHDLAWSHDGTRIGSASNDGSVQIWKAATGILLLYHSEQADAVYSVAWSLDGTRIASAGNDNVVQVWDVATNTTTFTYRGHTDAVYSVAWSLDGTRIASAGNDKMVRIWEVGTGATLLIYQGHADTVNSVAWSPDGKQLASASNDSSVQVSGAGITLLVYRGHKGEMSGAAWSPDSKQIASAAVDNQVQVWDAATGKRSITYLTTGVRAYSFAWSPNGKQLATTGSDWVLQVWDTATGKLSQTYPIRSDAVWALAWSLDGRYIALGGADMTVRVWNTVSGDTTLIYHGHSAPVHSLAWSLDGTRIVSGSNDKTVQIWDTTTGKTLYTYRGHTDKVYGVAWSPNGTRIASVGADKTVQVWDATTGSNAYNYRGHSNYTTALAWSPDGTRIASGSFDNTVRVWDSRMENTLGNTLYIYRGHTSYVLSVAWSHDGTRIASTGSYDRTVQVWQAV